MSLETFEDEVDTATTFQVGAEPQFTTDSALAVGFATGFFAGSSDYGLDTYVAGPQSAGPIGSITIAAGYQFTVDQIQVALSDDYSVTFVAGDLKFTGTLAGGGTATETISCSAGWDRAPWDSSTEKPRARPRYPKRGWNPTTSYASA